MSPWSGAPERTQHSRAILYERADTTTLKEDLVVLDLSWLRRPGPALLDPRSRLDRAQREIAMMSAGMLSWVIDQVSRTGALLGEAVDLGLFPPISAADLRSLLIEKLHFLDYVPTCRSSIPGASLRLLPGRRGCPPLRGRRSARPRSRRPRRGLGLRDRRLPGPPARSRHGSRRRPGGSVARRSRRADPPRGFRERRHRHWSAAGP